jgi:hypothetical protein
MSTTAGCVDVVIVGAGLLDVQPMEQIIRLRRTAIQTGLKQEVGARHITSFVAIVKHEGKLNEGMMPLMMTWKHPKYFLRIVPQGIRMFFKRKVPFPLMRAVEALEQHRDQEVAVVRNQLLSEMRAACRQAAV